MTSTDENEGRPLSELLTVLSHHARALEAAASAKSREPELQEARRKLGQAEQRLFDERQAHRRTTAAKRQVEMALERLAVAAGLPAFEPGTAVGWTEAVEAFAQEMKRLRASDQLTELLVDGSDAEVVGEGQEIVGELRHKVEVLERRAVTAERALEISQRKVQQLTDALVRMERERNDARGEVSRCADDLTQLRHERDVAMEELQEADAEIVGLRAEREAVVAQLRQRDATHAESMKVLRVRCEELQQDARVERDRAAELERELSAVVGRTREMISERRDVETERDDLQRRLDAALTRVGELDRDLRLAQQKGDSSKLRGESGQSDASGPGDPLSAFLRAVPPELVREVGRFFSDRK